MDQSIGVQNTKRSTFKQKLIEINKRLSISKYSKHEGESLLGEIKVMIE